MLIADFLVKLACIRISCGTQLSQWMDYLHPEWQAELTFHRVSVCKIIDFHIRRSITIDYN
jgi:hypothetical protein